MKVWISMMLLAVVAVGCAKNNANKSASLPENEDVMDIAPPTPPAQPPVAAAYQPATVQPVVSESPALSSAGETYTVKKGDTLYGIARAKYGDGKQFTRIVSANPGVSPQSLKVGQTLTLP